MASSQNPFTNIKDFWQFLKDSGASDEIVQNLKIMSVQISDLESKFNGLTDNSVKRVELENQFLTLSLKRNDSIRRFLELKKIELELKHDEAGTTNKEKTEIQGKLVELEKIVEVLQKKNEEHEKSLEIVEDLYDQLKEIEQITKSTADNFGTLTKNLFTLKDFSTTILGKFFELKKVGGSFKDVINQVGTKLEKMNKGLFVAEMGTKLIYKAMQKVKDNTLDAITAVNSLAASTSKITGQGNLYRKEIVEVGFDVVDFAVSFEETNASYQSLFQNMSVFSDLTKKQRKELAYLSSGLQNLGVDSSVSSELFQVLNKSLNLSSKQIVGVTKELVGLAKELKVPPKIILGDFSRAMKELSARGKEGIKVFKELASVSKKTGITISELQNTFGEALNTWDGVSKFASKMNIMLGGQYIDSVKMIYATETERIKILIKAIENSGKSFKNMTFFEKKAMASAAGISDMTKANKLFSMSLSAYDDMVTKADAARISQKKFELAAKASADMTKKLTIIKRNFTLALLPLIRAANKTLDWFTKLTKGMSAYTAVLGSLYILVGSLAISLGAIWLGGFMAGKGLAAAGVGAGSAAGGITVLSKAAEKGAKGVAILGGVMLTLAASAALIGVGVSQAGKGFSIASKGAGKFLDTLDKLKNIKANDIASFIIDIGVAVASLASFRTFAGAFVLEGIAKSLEPVNQIVVGLSKIDKMEFKSVEKLHEHLKGIAGLSNSLKPLVASVEPLASDSKSAKSISKLTVQTVVVKSPKVVVKNSSPAPIFKIDSLNVQFDANDPKSNGKKLSDALNELVGKRMART